MSTIKFVPMEFFAQFALTQMRRLQARGAVGAALGVRGGVGGRRSLFVRLSRRRVPIVNAGRCRRGFPGAGTSLADVESCWWAWGRCRRGFFWCVVAVGGRRSPLADAEAPLARLFQARGSAAPSCARPRPSARRTVLAARPALWLHVPIPPSWCVLPRPPVGRTPPALPPRRVPLRRLTFPRKDATIISLFAAAWPSAERPTGCGAVW